MKSKRISIERTEKMQMSAIRVILDKAAAMRAEGIKVTALSAGEPDFPTPEPIKRAAMKAIEENCTHYGANRGLLALRKCISDMMMKDTGVFYDPATEVILTVGGAEGLNNTILAFAQPQDEVIIFTPAFTSYRNLVIEAGAIPVEIPLKAEDHFHPKPEALRAAITERTKMVVMNNPNNPSAAVYTREELQEIADIVTENDLLLLSDEMYSRLVYDGKFISMAEFPGMKERTIIVNGFSKAYAMTGWRTGYILADESITPSIMKIHQYSTTCSPTFIHVGLANSLEDPDTEAEIAHMLEEFARRREMVVELLDTLPNVKACSPEGAFYVLLNVSETGMDGETFAAKLLEEKQVALVPALSMGTGDEMKDYVRISFAASMETIVEGFTKMREFLCK